MSTRKTSAKIEDHHRFVARKAAATKIPTATIEKAVTVLTVSAVEAAIGTPTADWKGKCYGIASAIVEARPRLVRDGTAVYGHYRGPVHAKSMFYARSGMGFIQHGWVSFPDGSVLDPTRWVFEHVEPYLYTGPASRDYDEGGNAFRAARLRIPDYDPEEKQYRITKNVMDGPTWTFVEKHLQLEYDGLGGGPSEPGVLCASQIHYLAHAPLETLGKHAAGVYQAIKALGRVALIPIDNLRRVEEGRWNPKP